MKTKKSAKKPRGVPISKIEKRQKGRTKLSKTRDLAKNNSTIVKPSSPRVKSWLKDPGSMDVRGVDTANKKKAKASRKHQGAKKHKNKTSK
jgi:hypothetical protein